MSPLAFFEQLADTPWSMALHESEIAYSIIESVHVWSLVLFFGLVIVFDLRLLGWAFQKVPVSEFSRRLLPWTILGFVLMAITGTLLVYAIPVRSYQNPFFRFKMILMLLAGINVLIFHSRVFPGITTWDNDAKPPRLYRRGPPFRRTSRLIVDGARPSCAAILRIDKPATRPRDISSRSCTDSDRRDRTLVGGAIPPLESNTPKIEPARLPR